MKLKALCAWTLILIAISTTALAEFGAADVRGWLYQLAQQLPAQTLYNQPEETADPARPCEYLFEYAFGTVLASTAQTPNAEQIIKVDLRSTQAVDCRGMSVGMTLEQVLGSEPVLTSGTPLYVLHTRSDEPAWSWAYVGEQGIYGLEWMVYDLSEPASAQEYTLTYVLGADSRIDSIQMKIAQTTQAQAEAGLRTACEIASRQQGEALALQNAAGILNVDDLQVMNRLILGITSAELVSFLGEPVEVQTLPGGGGRILLYEGAVVKLDLLITTGEEIVKGITVSGTGLTGPRGLRAGMSIQEASALYRCDADVYAVGGTLYIEGEARGEAPYGELTVENASEYALRYLCLKRDNQTAVLEIGIVSDEVAYWRIYDKEDGWVAQDEHGNTGTI